MSGAVRGEQLVSTRQERAVPGAAALGAGTRGWEPLPGQAARGRCGALRRRSQPAARVAPCGHGSRAGALAARGSSARRPPPRQGAPSRGPGRAGRSHRGLPGAAGDGGSCHWRGGSRGAGAAAATVNMESIFHERVSE